MKALLAIAILPLAVVGCAGFGMGGMSADQISAASKDKSSSAGCTQYIGTGGSFIAAYTNTDKGTLNSGGGTVTIKCGPVDFTFTDAGKAGATAPVPPVAPKATP